MCNEGKTRRGRREGWRSHPTRAYFFFHNPHAIFRLDAASGADAAKLSKMSKPQIILNAGCAAIAMAIAYRLANLMLDSVLPKKTQEGRRGGTRGPPAMILCAMYLLQMCVNGDVGAARWAKVDQASWASAAGAPAKWYWEESCRDTVTAHLWRRTFPYGSNLSPLGGDRSVPAARRSCPCRPPYHANVLEMKQTNVRTGFWSETAASTEVEAAPTPGSRQSRLPRRGGRRMGACRLR